MLQKVLAETPVRVAANIGNKGVEALLRDGGLSTVSAGDPKRGTQLRPGWVVAAPLGPRFRFDPFPR